MRNLTSIEVDALKAQGCSAQSWQDIQVSDDFSTLYIQQVNFSGKIQLGSFLAEFQSADGRLLHSGIYHASLHNCTVADDVYIASVSGVIANTEIGKNTHIMNVGSIACPPACTFGNGVEVAALNEGGGREVPICNILSAQVAYWLTCYRYRTDLVKALTGLIHAYVRSQQSDYAMIGENVTIADCANLTGVNVGDYATLSGCTRLTNGTVLSCKEAPSQVGDNVIAQDFIVCTDASVTDGVMLERCFIGQGTQVGKQFSATDALFFANCQAFHGEADSVFAGPYSVTHHRGSLLIAGMYSFMNVGSSSNQSNHAYKLGPNHQGWLQRGCKLASGSHLVWPAQIGAFCMVMGHHAYHPDALDFPFSYLIEEGGRVSLVPGAVLKTVGVIRDAQKWPKRDRRADSCRLDVVDATLFTPYTVAMMENGKNLLQSLQKDGVDKVVYKGMTISRSALEHGIALYQMAIDKYVGDVLTQRLENGLSLDAVAGDASDWLDWGGFLTSRSACSDLLNKVENGGVKSVEDLNDEVAKLSSGNKEREWTWIVKHYGPFNQSNLKEWFERWHQAAAAFDDNLLKDASKEFSATSMLSYGVDDVHAVANDYEQVHGTYEDCSFFKMVQTHQKRNDEKFSSLIGK